MLAESAAIKKDAFTSLYRDYGDHVLDLVLDYHHQHEGISRVKKIRHCHQYYLNINLTDDGLDELCNNYSHYVKNAVINCPWVAGAERLLKAVYKNIDCYVASGTPEDELNDIVRARHMGHYFKGVYGSPRLKNMIVTDVFARIQYDLNRCVFIGDAMTDYNAAKILGMDFIGRVLPGRASPFPKGTRIIDDLSALYHEITRIA